MNLCEINGEKIYFIVKPWEFEISIQSTFILLIAIFFITDLIQKILSIPNRINSFRKSLLRNKHDSLVNQYLIELLQKFKSEKLATKLFAISHSDKISKNKIFIAQFCAKEAHIQGKYEECELMMKFAREQARLVDNTSFRNTCILSADFLLDHGRVDEALSLLNIKEVRKIHDSNLQYMLLRAAILLRNHKNVIILARQLLQLKAISKEYAEILISKSGCMYMHEKLDNGFSCVDVWKEFKGDECFLPDLVLSAVGAFESIGKLHQASLILEKAIEARFDTRLIAAYAHCSEKQAIHRLSKAEKWLENRRGDSNLLITLGILCLNAELWGNAEHYFLLSLKSNKKLEVHNALGQLYEHLGRMEEAKNQRAIATMIVNKSDSNSSSRKTKKNFPSSKTENPSIYARVLCQFDNQ